MGEGGWSGKGWIFDQCTRNISEHFIFVSARDMASKSFLQGGYTRASFRNAFP